MPSAASAAPSPSAAAELRRALRELLRAQALRDRGRAAAEGLTAAGAHALEALAGRRGTSLTALAAELCVDRSTACRTVGLLEDRGLVRRLPDAHDGRAIAVMLTATGSEAEARLRAGALAEAEAILAAIGARRRAALPSVLRQAADVLSPG